MSLIQKTRTVYILSSALTPKVYIGSTCKKLTTRLSEHKNISNKCKSLEIIQLGEYKISPLCIIENCTRKEIELKEQDFIFCFKDICVNISGTKDSYSKKYEGRIKAEKNHYIARSEKITCECGSVIRKSGISYHLKSKKHISS